jgi:hypothetical protein
MPNKLADAPELFRRPGALRMGEVLMALLAAAPEAADASSLLWHRTYGTAHMAPHMLRSAILELTV